MKAWKWFCLQQHKNRELCDIPEDELKLLSCKLFKTVKELDGTKNEPVSLTCFQQIFSVPRTKEVQTCTELRETSSNSVE